MVLGVYYLTKMDKLQHKGDGSVFSDMDEAELAYALKHVDIHAKIRLLVLTWYDEKNNRLSKPEVRLIETTVGKILFNRVLPPEIQFVNWELDRGGLKDLMASLYQICGEENTPAIADAIKDIGFTYATRSGYSLAVSDITIPVEKSEIINEALQQAEEVTRDFRRGLLTEQESNERVIEIWQKTTSQVADSVKRNMDPNGNLSDFWRYQRWFRTHLSAGWNARTDG
jgi:DNA-directed RNA polymerase subunit beta'